MVERVFWSFQLLGRWLVLAKVSLLYCLAVLFEVGWSRCFLSLVLVGLVSFWCFVVGRVFWSFFCSGEAAAVLLRFCACVSCLGVCCCVVSGLWLLLAAV